jgi:hypothetical protein
MSEKVANETHAEANHARALELRQSLSSQLDKTGFERIEKIVNDAVMGPYRTERTEAKKAERMGKSREEVRGLIDIKSRKTDGQAVEEVLVKIKEMGIVGDETRRFVSQLIEYVVLVNELNLVKN